MTANSGASRAVGGGLEGTAGEIRDASPLTGPQPPAERQARDTPVPSCAAESRRPLESALDSIQQDSLCGFHRAVIRVAPSVPGCPAPQKTFDFKAIGVRACPEKSQDSGLRG